MIGLDIRFDAKRMEAALIAAVGDQARRNAASTALTRTVAASRIDIKGRLPGIFDRPTPFTMQAVRYQAATAETLSAKVYISDDASRGLSPRKYLGPEMLGGRRLLKGSERRLQLMGMMDAGQALVPSTQTRLDSYGNVPGSRMVTILSRVAAFGTGEGYLANASAFTKKRLAKAKRAAATSGTDYFVAHSKRGGEPLGIWQVVGKGQVRPVLIFANKMPTYRDRFHFQRLVEDFAAKHFHDEFLKALLAGIRHA